MAEEPPPIGRILDLSEYDTIAFFYDDSLHNFQWNQSDIDYYDIDQEGKHKHFDRIDEPLLIQSSGDEIRMSDREYYYKRTFTATGGKKCLVLGIHVNGDNEGEKKDMYLLEGTRPDRSTITGSDSRNKEILYPESGVTPEQVDSLVRVCEENHEKDIHVFFDWDQCLSKFNGSPTRYRVTPLFTLDDIGYMMTFYVQGECIDRQDAQMIIDTMDKSTLVEEFSRMIFNGESIRVEQGVPVDHDDDDDSRYQQLKDYFAMLRDMDIPLYLLSAGFIISEGDGYLSDHPLIREIAQHMNLLNLLDSPHNSTEAIQQRNNFMIGSGRNIFRVKLFSIMKVIGGFEYEHPKPKPKPVEPPEVGEPSMKRKKTTGGYRKKRRKAKRTTKRKAKRKAKRTTKRKAKRKNKRTKKRKTNN